MTGVEVIAQALGKNANQLKLEDIQRALPGIRHKADQYEKEALTAERAALEARAKAFSPETPASERAVLMRRAADCAAQARQLEGFTNTFLVQLGNYTSLETTMKIVEQMSAVGLFEKGKTAVDWQRALDDMQIEIKRMTELTAKFNEAMSSAMPSVDAGSPSPEVDELERLFRQWEAETDPLKKEEIKKKIDQRTNVAMA